MEPLIEAVVVTSNNTGAESVQVYDVATGTHLKSYRGDIAAQSTLCFVGQAEYLMAAVRDKPFLQAWALPRHETLQIRLIVPGKACAMAVSPSGPKYCVIGIAEKLTVYKLVTGRMIGVSSRHYQPVTCLKFTPCGNYFASGGEDGFVYLWSLGSFIETLHKQDAPQVQPHFILGQHSDKVTDLAMTSSGIQGFLVSSSLDHTAKVFDLVTGRLIYNIISATGITSVACNSLGSQVFLGNSNGTVNIANLLPHPPPGDVQVSSNNICHTNSVRHIAVTTTGNQLVTGGEDGDVKVWSIAGLPLASLENASNHNPSLALQKVVHTGRGRINNLAILRTDREALSDADREVEEVIAPFSQDFSNPLNAEVTIPIRGKGKPQPQHLDIFNFATDPCFDSVEPEKGPDYKNELEESVISLQENNKDLYNFAMKQILRKTPKGGKGSANRKTNNKGKKASANKNRYFDTKEKK
ncbi:WD repeat-containing protein 18 isoform X1 [Penaeus vannamei]|uniref:WD repeat-containing protein 18 isoform X1 n=2 Tax=Penaeus vannamei TaxID=6689 RepID=UPI00387F8E75